MSDQTDSADVLGSLPDTPITVSTLYDLHDHDAIKGTVVDHAYRRPGDGENDLVLTFGLPSNQERSQE